MEEPPLKITVATVCYNAASLIARPINSVEEQDYPHVEHLIIDGNSQDATLEAVHHYQERNSVARVPHEVNCLSEPAHGIYDAMNTALRMATGHYILFLNAGDTLHSRQTLSLVACAATAAYGDHALPEADDSDLGMLPAVVYGQTDIVDEQGHFLRHRRLTAPEVLTWRAFRHGMTVCHQAFFARTDLARRMVYNTAYRFSADYDWCIRLMREGQRRGLELTNVHQTVANYLSEGATTRHHRASLMERLRIMAHHYGWGTALAMHAWFVVRGIIKK